MKNEYEPTPARLALFLQTMLVYGRNSEEGLDSDLCDLLHNVPMMINDPRTLEFFRDSWTEHLREFDREHGSRTLATWVGFCAIAAAISNEQEGAWHV